MVEVGVVFHQVPICVSINVRRPAQQVAGGDGRFGPQGFQKILHLTIEPAVQLDAELHGVGVAGGAVLTAPVPRGLVDRLHKSTFRDAHGAGCWVFVLPQGTDALIGPSLLKLIPAAIFRQQEVAELLQQLFPIGGHPWQIFHICRTFYGGVLVVDLKGHHRRVVQQPGAGIGVYMAKEFLGVLLLQLDQPPVYHGVALQAGAGLSGVVQAVPLLESPGYNEIDVQVDAMLLQLAPEVVEPVQPIRVESAGSAAFIVQQGRLPAGGPAARLVPDGGVGCVKADDVHPQAGEARCQLVGGFVVRCVGAGGQVEPNKAGPRAVFKVEVTVPHYHMAVLAGGGVQQVGKVQGAHVRGGFVDGDMLFHKTLLSAVFPGSLSRGFCLFFRLLFQILLVFRFKVQALSLAEGF